MKMVKILGTRLKSQKRFIWFVEIRFCLFGWSHIISISKTITHRRYCVIVFGDEDGKEVKKDLNKSIGFGLDATFSL